MTVWHNKGK